jgi:hypothetical protein
MSNDDDRQDETLQNDDRQDDDVRDDVRHLHDHLVALQGLPVERSASRWIGEAESVVGDLVDGDVDRAVLRKRLSHVEELLANVDGTEDQTADEHVADAKRITTDLLDRLDEE